MWLKSIFGESTKVFGLYGLSECGFIGISRESEENYILRDTSYFVENTAENGIVVTSFDTRAPIPLLRYRTGDVGTLEATETGYILGSVTRAGTDFNYMGNLLSYDAIKDVALRVVGTSDFSMQLHLSTDAHGTDALTVCILEHSTTGEIEEALTAALLQMPEIREGYEKTAGRLHVKREPWTAARITARQKEALVIDDR
jgi:indoleacetate--lysine synthetase